MNLVILSGNVGSLNTGQNVVFLSIATDHYTNKAGQEVTEWIDVKVFGNQAAACAKHLVKGQHVEIQAKLSKSSYVKDGKTFYSQDAVAKFVKFGHKPNKTNTVEPDQNLDIPDVQF